MENILTKYRCFLQFLKFGIVGIINTGIDLTILYLLIWISGYNNGWQYTVFKTISFVIAVINSYFLNKFWTFKINKKDKIVVEFTQFLIISLIGLGINVVTASLVVNIIHPLFGISVTLWAVIGALCGTAIGLLWNFIGYKLIVFKE